MINAKVTILFYSANKNEFFIPLSLQRKVFSADIDESILQFDIFTNPSFLSATVIPRCHRPISHLSFL